MRSLNQIFFRGLITLLPIAVTIYVLYSSILILDSLLGTILRRILPEYAYFPGLGFALMLLMVFLFGLLLNNFFTARFFSWVEKQLMEVPFFKAIYSPLRDLMNLFSKKGANAMGSVVLVRMGDSGAQALGLVTREHFHDLPFSASAEDKVAVYFPLSYGLGGFTFMVPKTSLTEIDLPVEKAMSLAITGWVKAESPDEHKERH